MLKIFITAKILADFVSKEATKQDHERSSFYRILKNKKYSKIYVGTIDNQSMNKINNFKQMNDFAIDKTKSKYVDSIPSNPKLVMQEPNSLFILNISKDEASNISSTYGVLCFSADSIDYYKLIDPNIEYSPYTKEYVAGGWASILENVKNIPSNALIIVDRYLFTNDTKTFYNGINNLFSILKLLLPEKHDKEFKYQVCVVFSACSEDKKGKALSFNELATLVNKKKKELARSYPINIEMICISSDSRFYNDTHNRRIVSNYYIVRAEHQLGAFFGNNSSCSQTLTPQRLFTYYCLRSYSDPPMKSIEQTAKTLCSLSDILKSEILHKLCYYAINGITMTPDKCKIEDNLRIINRILLR